MEPGVRIAIIIEQLLNINCSSEQTADTARQFLFYDEDMPDTNIPASAVDLDEMIDDLACPKPEDPESLIFGSQNFYKLLSLMKLRSTT